VPSRYSRAGGIVDSYVAEITACPSMTNQSVSVGQEQEQLAGIHTQRKRKSVFSIQENPSVLEHTIWST